MKKIWRRPAAGRGFLAAAVLAAFWLSGQSVKAEVLDFEGEVKSCQEQAQEPQYSEVKDSSGKAVQVVKTDEVLYVSLKKASIRQEPDKNGKWLTSVYLGSKLRRTGVCDNGWSQVLYEEKGKDPVEGYMNTSVLGEDTQITKFTDTAEVVQDTEILDYPARKEGEVIGELQTSQQVTCTGMIDYIWSRIFFEDQEGKEQVGYVPLSSLKVKGMVAPTASSAGAETVDAGIIHKSDGTGIFADAVEGVTLEGVQEGTPVAASADAALKPLGTFRITHYCPCSICCGPWGDGITSTGVIAVTNHTIAVDPDQIPYGSKVVINGQVYVAEDCGGAIRENCIDIYVATHEEGENRGVYYTDVYLLLE